MIRSRGQSERRRQDAGTATATATADAANHAGGRRWLAPNQCRAASAYNVPPRPAIARPGGGRRRTALDRGRRRGQAGASAALRSLQRRQPLSHPSEPARQAASVVGRGGAEAARRGTRILRKAAVVPRPPFTGRREECGVAGG